MAKRSSSVYDGSGHIIGDRGGSRPESLKTTYQHIGGGRRDGNGELKGGLWKGRYRSVFNARTRQDLEQDYMPGSIIVKPSSKLATATRDITGWPTRESRLSGADLVRRNHIKVGGAAVALVWAGFSYEASPLPSVVPSPTRAISAAWNVPDSLDEKLFGSPDKPKSPPTVVVDVPESTVTTEPNQTATTLPPFGSAAESTVAQQPPTIEVAPQPSTSIESAVAFTSGSMTCSATIEVTIGQDEFAFNALARTTEEPLDDLPQAEAEALWSDIVLKLNEGQVDNEPGQTFVGPDNCYNYPTISSGYID
jgi:hypothetical protein